MEKLFIILFQFIYYSLRDESGLYQCEFSSFLWWQGYEKILWPAGARLMAFHVSGKQYQIGESVGGAHG